MPDVARAAPTGARPDPPVRGACPSGHRPFVAADGLLVRVRVPGGELTCDQVAAVSRVAKRDGSGVVELTSRANLQIRGVRPGTLAALRADLETAGLVPADAAADERRNVVAAPAAGLDPSEVADVRPIVRRLLARLASGEPAARLHPKAGAVVDGGGAVSVRGRRHDVGLGAVRRRDSGEVVAELALGRPLPPGPDPNGSALVVPLADAAAVAAHALALTAPHPARPDGTADPGHDEARQPVPRPTGTGTGDDDARTDGTHGTDGTHDAGTGEAQRMHEIVAGRGFDAVVAEIERRAGVAVERVPARLLDRATPVPGAPLGAQAARTPDTVVVGAAPVLGRLDAGSLARLAAAGHRHGDGTIRLTPWRSLLLPGVHPRRAGEVLAELAALGLATDPTDPATAVVACVGRAGCEAGPADTLADGRRLVDELRLTALTTPGTADTASTATGATARPPTPTGATHGGAPGRSHGGGVPSVHLSGCAKRCASRQVHDVTLVGVGPDRYDVFVRDPRSGDERLARRGAGAGEALQACTPSPGRGESGSTAGDSPGARPPDTDYTPGARHPGPEAAVPPHPGPRSERA